MLLFLLCLLSSVTVWALYPSSSGVVDLTASNFNRMVVESDEIWLVEFYAPWCGHCKSLVPEYEKAAKALRGVVKVGAVNADQEKSLGGQYGVRGFPTIKFFGTNKRKPDDYEGARTAEGLVDAALAAAKRKVKAALGGDSGGGGSDDSKDVVELTDGNFDSKVTDSEDLWLVEFYAPWCGHCKNLAPQWAKAASELKGKVKLGALDATVHTLKAQKYGIQGYPTIKFFRPGKNSDAEDYDGGRTSSDIVSWALEKLAANIPPPEIVQVTGQDVFKKSCDFTTSLCVVTVLPHIYDCQAKCRDTYLDILRALGEKYKQKMWGWLWTQAGDQFALEESLDIGGFGYPAMAVVNVKKMKYSILRGSFSKQGIDEFLRDLSYGRGNTALVKGGELARIVDVPVWDGKDAEIPVEEDVDLSDVDLEEDEEASKDEL